MRTARVCVHGVPAATLDEIERSGRHRLRYLPDYCGPPVSLTMPVATAVHEFGGFPPFFDGLLPEGGQLEALLRLAKLDGDDLFGQIVAVGSDLVGAVTVELLPDADEDRDEGEAGDEDGDDSKDTAPRSAT